MHGRCINCDFNISDLINSESSDGDIITCLGCGTKLIMNYDEYNDGYENIPYWWFDELE